MTDTWIDAAHYVYRWFHLIPGTAMPGLTVEERLPFNEYLYWKPLNDKYLFFFDAEHGAEGPKFEQWELDELTTDFEAEMEAWKSRHLSEYAAFSETELFDRLNCLYLNFLIDRWQRKGKKPDCDHYEISRAPVGRITDEKRFGGLEAFDEAHVAGKVRHPERRDSPEPERPFRPAQEWLKTDGDWRFWLIGVLLHDAEKFEVLMTALEGETLKVPRRRRQKEPMAQRLLLDHTDDRIDHRIMEALGLGPSGSTALKRRRWRHRSTPEHEKALRRYRQATERLAKERDRASRP